MSKEPKKMKPASKHQHVGFTFVKENDGFSEYTLNCNGLTVLHYEMPDTGVVTTNIVYRVGARDEQIGESGLAHMLEHMLFKPTKGDLKKKIDSGAMQFERDTGALLNATTWKDRTMYFFSYPKEYTRRALQIEADRMDNVILSDKEFLPERSNVLSEFDMYNGDPLFALSAAMVASAFTSHPYQHETIGSREDIEDYTVEKLQRFYTEHYRPNNATLMIFGDISRTEALELASREFSKKRNPKITRPRRLVREPQQEGIRRAEIVRPSNTNIVTLGMKHPGFPSQGWYETALLFDILTDGPESILHKSLIDSGKAVSVEPMLEPTSEENLSMIYITLTKKAKHTDIEQLALKTIRALTVSDIAKLLKKAVEQAKTDLFFARGSSYAISKDIAEFVSAGDWEQYVLTEKKLSTITATDVLAQRDKLFDTQRMTIGYFIGNA